MSDFMGVSKNLMREKWMKMNWILAIDLIFLFAITIIHIFTDGLSDQLDFIFASFSISTIVANIVALIILAKKNEQVFTSNNYRLLPVTDTKLYFSNLLTTFLAFVYLQIIEVLIAGIMYGLEGGRLDSFGINNGNIPNAVISVMVLLILGIIVLWTGITLVHLIISFISGFLPFGRQKFVMFILYLVVIFVGLNIFNFATGNIFEMIYTRSALMNLNKFSNVIWISNGVFLVWAAIFSAINIYLLKRWTETVR